MKTEKTELEKNENVVLAYLRAHVTDGRIKLSELPIGNKQDYEAHAWTRRTAAVITELGVKNQVGEEYEFESTGEGYKTQFFEATRDFWIKSRGEADWNKIYDDTRPVRDELMADQRCRRIVEVAKQLDSKGKTSGSTSEIIAAAFLVDRVEWLEIARWETAEAAWRRLGEDWQDLVTRMRAAHLPDGLLIDQMRDRGYVVESACVELKGGR